MAQWVKKGQNYISVKISKLPLINIPTNYGNLCKKTPFQKTPIPVFCILPFFSNVASVNTIFT